MFQMYALTKPMSSISEVALYLQIEPYEVTYLINEKVLPAYGSKKHLLKTCDVISFASPVSFGNGMQIKRLLNDVLTEMLFTRISDLSGSTQEDYDNSAKRISAYFENKCIESILPKDLELFYMGLCNNKNGNSLSDHTVKTIRKLMNMLFKYAYDNKYIERNITSNVRVISGYKTDKDSRFLSTTQIGVLLTVLRDHPRYYTLVRLLVASGLRIGEALALNYTDFIRERGVVRITKSLKKGEKKKGCSYAREVIIGLPKTSSSFREVPIPVEIFDLIENYRTARISTKSFKNATKKGYQDNVFANAYGDLTTYRTLNYNFHLYLKRRILPVGFPKVTFHMLRHSYGSLLLEKGVSLAVVSKLLGHINIEITADIYITITQKLLQQASLTCVNFLDDIDDAMTQIC